VPVIAVWHQLYNIKLLSITIIIINYHYVFIMKWLIVCNRASSDPACVNGAELPIQSAVYGFNNNIIIVTVYYYFILILLLQTVVTHRRNILSGLRCIKLSYDRRPIDRSGGLKFAIYFYISSNLTTTPSCAI